MSENALAVRQQMSMTDAMEAAKHMAASGFFQDARDASQAVVKVLAGQELGLGPFASMTGIHIIKGRPALGANVIATLIKNDPRYDYRVLEMTNTNCNIRFFECGQPVGESTFSAQDAQKAGTQNMGKFPRNMLFARAISNGARWYTPGIFGGSPVYTPEELGAQVDEDGYIVGEVVEHEPQPQPQIVQSTAIDDGPNWANATWPTFIEYCIETIPRYENEIAVKGALKKLGFNTWPVKGESVIEQREAMYVDLKLYASYRNAGMSQEDAMAAMVDDMFGASEEE